MKRYVLLLTSLVVCAVLLATMLWHRPALSTQYTSSPIDTTKLKKFAYRHTFTADGTHSSQFAIGPVLTDLSFSVSRCLSSECIEVAVFDFTTLVTRRSITAQDSNGEITFTTGYPTGFGSVSVVVSVTGFPACGPNCPLEVSVILHGFSL
jgi:hypothetical protein